MCSNGHERLIQRRLASTSASACGAETRVLTAAIFRFAPTRSQFHADSIVDAGSLRFEEERLVEAAGVKRLPPAIRAAVREISAMQDEPVRDVADVVDESPFVRGSHPRQLTRRIVVSPEFEAAR